MRLQRLEHRAAPCAPSPESFRGSPGVSALQTHWTHRLKVYVPTVAMLLCTESIATAQSQPEVRRARPIDESPAPRALPADESIDRALRSLKDESSEAPARETE